MARSRFSSWMARENSGANFRVAVWLRMMLMSLVIATVNDRNDMKARTITTPLAKVPAAVHRCNRSTFI
jgi:hypothetical protein